jgi:transglutaminase-like putative cysteine protease
MIASVEAIGGDAVSGAQPCAGTVDAGDAGLSSVEMRGAPAVAEQQAATLRLHVGCLFQHRLDCPVPMVLEVEPRADGPHRVLGESWETSGAFTEAFRDVYGNTCRRVVMPPGESTIRYDAQVEVPDALDPADEAAPQLPVQELPGDTLLYTLPSRLCPSDELSTTAWRMFGGLEPTYARVQRICDWVHDSVDFRPDLSTPQTTATAVLLQRGGVCRDYAQLAVSFCRALNIPARYTLGYLPDIGVEPPDHPMDFCAWFEAYLGDRWWTFDPRNNQRRRGRVVIGRGRDAVDVAMITSYGTAPLTGMTVWAEPVEAAAGPEAAR